MLETDQFVKIGQVLKSNGTDGQVIIRLYDVAPEAAQIEEEPVYVYFDGLPVPFFISNPAIKGSGKISAYLTDIHTLEDAEELVGKAIWLPADRADADSGELDLVGWTVKTTCLSGDGPASILGTVTALEDIPGNPCIEVKTERDSVLLPLHEDFILECDPKKRVLVMSLPEGLV